MAIFSSWSFSTRSDCRRSQNDFRLSWPLAWISLARLSISLMLRRAMPTWSARMFRNRWSLTV